MSGERQRYIARRLREGGLRLVSGSSTMLQDEFERFERERVERHQTKDQPHDN